MRLPTARILIAVLGAGLAAAIVAAWLSVRLTTGAAPPQGAAPVPGTGAAGRPADVTGSAAADHAGATDPAAAPADDPLGRATASVPGPSTTPGSPAPGSPPASTTAAAPAARDPARSSLQGSAVAIGITLAGILAVAPWRTRPAGTWAFIWLAGSVGRLLVTPLVGLAVYSATPVRKDAFLLSLAGTYLACLAAEVAVSASGLARQLAVAEAGLRRDPARP